MSAPIDYSKFLPETPEGMGWHLSWIDIKQESTLVIELHIQHECIHRKVLAVDLYGAAGVRETGEWMLDKWRTEATA